MTLLTSDDLVYVYINVVVIRFIQASDYNWFEKTMIRVTGEDIGEEFVEFVTPTHYFVDFIRYLVSLLKFPK